MNDREVAKLLAQLNNDLQSAVAHLQQYAPGPRAVEVESHTDAREGLARAVLHIAEAQRDLFQDAPTAPSRIPPMVREGIDEYVRIGRPPGDFVRAVLEDRLVEAYQAADPFSAAAMHAIAAYVYNHVPEAALKSREAVDRWCEQGGLDGLMSTSEPGGAA